MPLQPWHQTTPKVSHGCFPRAYCYGYLPNTKSRDPTAIGTYLSLLSLAQIAALADLQN